MSTSTVTTSAPRSSPWGSVQHSTVLADGIVRVSTSSHGGIWLSRERQARMPLALKMDTNWYEEDCDWACVAVAYPEAFQRDYEIAVETLKHWKWTMYELHFGITLQPGESNCKDEAIFYATHANDLLVYSAVGSWHADCPEGMVLVTACIGQRDNLLTKPARRFLVPKEDYESRGKFSFVVDPSKYIEILPV